MIPVWSGSFTGWRSITPGAFHSSGRRSVDVDRALTVERVAERVDDAAEQRLADRDRRDLAGAADGIALLDLLPLAKERDTDVVLLEVEGEADDAVVELEHLERKAVLEAVDACDAVAEREHRADLGEVRVEVELLDPLAQDRVISSGLAASLGRVNSLGRGAQLGWRSRSQAAAHAGVQPHRSGLQDDPADQIRLDAARRLHLAARLPLDLGEDALEVRVGELVRRRHLDARARAPRR